MAADKVVATNRKAVHHYEVLETSADFVVMAGLSVGGDEVLETYEAGLVLRGTEVKSLRESQVNFKDCYAAVDNDDVWLIGCYISPYHHGSDANHDPERRRKLLLHRREVARLVGKIAERGLTLIPLRLSFKKGRAKCELGLARGKKLHDKRASLREREAKREMDREARARQRA